MVWLFHHLHPKRPAPDPSSYIHGQSSEPLGKWWWNPGDPKKNIVTPLVIVVNIGIYWASTKIFTYVYICTYIYIIIYIFFLLIYIYICLYRGRYSGYCNRLGTSANGYSSTISGDRNWGSRLCLCHLPWCNSKGHHSSTWPNQNISSYEKLWLRDILGKIPLLYRTSLVDITLYM